MSAGRIEGNSIAKVAINKGWGEAKVVPLRFTFGKMSHFSRRNLRILRTFAPKVVIP